MQVYVGTEYQPEDDIGPLPVAVFADKILGDKWASEMKFKDPIGVYVIGEPIEIIGGL